MSDCIFCQIAQRKTSTNLIYENEHVAAFYDLDPQAPTHILIIPKQHIATINESKVSDTLLLGEMLQAAKKIAHSEQISETGYRLVFNCNEDGGQTVFHIHLHLLGGRQMAWPPG